MKNIKHILKGVASGLIWGLGQLFNKQYLKALFFFIFFALFVFIELSTGKIVSGYDPYQQRLDGRDFSDNEAENFYKYYKFNSLNPIPEFDEYYLTSSADGNFTMDELIYFTALNIKKESSPKYFSLSSYISKYKKGNEFINVSSTKDLLLDNEEDVNKINSLTLKSITTISWLDPVTKIEYAKTESKEDKNVYVYVNRNNESDILSKEEVEHFLILERSGKLFYSKTDTTKIYLQVTINKAIVYYENLIDPTDKLYVSSYEDKPEDCKIYDGAKYSAVPKYKGTSIYVSNDDVFVYYYPDNINCGYYRTTFSSLLTEFFDQRYKNSDYDQTDFARFKLLVYFNINENVKNEFEKNFDNFYFDRAGFFLKGIWSVITLGSANTREFQEISYLTTALDSSTFKGGSTPIEKIVVRGHLSSNLLISGLIAVLLLCYFVVFLVWSARDAYTTSRKYDETGEKLNTKQYFKSVYEGSFEYIVLMPALFTITFVSIMPILFSFLVAFTSYSGNEADAGLFEWIGFANFTKIFVFGGNIPFGKVFWKVFTWTVIWAVLSTATVFFGGFLQAIIINSERVPLKKFWRTLYILPWAIPAIITQMVFANIFNEVGVVNAFLRNIGAYDLFKSWGILGKPFSEVTGTIQKIFYLGADNIQWFTNPYNPWFVRIVLVIVNIWIGFPYYMALMTGVMIGIDETLYEAADIDGATKKQKFNYITFPLVMYSTAPLLVMSFSGNFNNFGMIYFVTQGGAHHGDIAYAYAGDTDILISWMFSLTVDYKNYNMASVFSIIIFFIVGSIAAWNYSRTQAFKED